MTRSERASMRHPQSAFTLIELLVVIAVIAVLAAVVAPNAFRAIEKAKGSNVLSTAKAIKTAVYGYYADTGRWPPRVAPGSIYLNTNSFLQNDGVPGWDGPYLEKWNARHPWGGTWFVRMDIPGGSDALTPGVIDLYCGLNNDPEAPSGARQKIDAMIDDGVPNAWSVRDGCGATSCELHIGVATAS